MGLHRLTLSQNKPNISVVIPPRSCARPNPSPPLSVSHLLAGKDETGVRDGVDTGMNVGQDEQLDDEDTAL